MSSHVILSGSHREHPAGAAFLGKPSPDEILHISCILRRKGEAPDPPVGRVSHQQFERMHGADPADVAAVECFANEHGFSVVRIDPAARAITLAGKYSALAATFGADVDIRRIPFPSRVALVAVFSGRARGCRVRVRSKTSGRNAAPFLTANRTECRVHTSPDRPSLQLSQQQRSESDHRADRTGRGFQQFGSNHVLATTRLAASQRHGRRSGRRDQQSKRRSGQRRR